MADASFNDKFEQIRKRFAGRFDDAVAETTASLPLLDGEGQNAIQAVEAAYHRLHQMCGSGRTLGFSHLGHAAGAAEAILLDPFRERRALTSFEVGLLRQALDALRAAARIDLHFEKDERGQSA